MGRGDFMNRFVSDSVEISAGGKFLRIYFSLKILLKKHFISLKFSIHKLRVLKYMCHGDVVKTK